MPITEDQIKEKYLERAIRELNQLTHELQDCEECPRGSLMPVLGSGHPQADVMLLKHSPSVAEIEEGVAFYGRSGTAVMKSLKRLGIDPLVVYGTLCVKCPLSDPALASPTCVSRLVARCRDRRAAMHRRHGRAGARMPQRRADPARRHRSRRSPGEIQALTPTIDVVYTPDIDASLDAEGAKRDFWRAFRSLGEWYEDLPPY